MEPSDNTTYETIKRRTEQRLTELKIDMKSASLRAGLGETFVRDMLRRNRAPGADSLTSLAPVLGTTVAWLTGETSDSGGAEPTIPNLPTPEVVTVPEYDVRLSAGPGMLIEAENQTGVWQFSRSYLVDELRLTPANLAIVEVEGDSMEPTLRSGDRVLIDHTDRNPSKPGVYAIWDGSATVVKRLERVPASDPPMVVLISDNKNHNQYTVLAELVNIIGRVVWFGRRM